MKYLKELFENNKNWVNKIKADDPDFFNKLSEQQAPEYLWFGCADSRVPANQITGLLPGDVFVHRNVANIITHSDINALSVLQYAVEVLKVKHIIVCGHYKCGGVQAAMTDEPLGLIDLWLSTLRRLREKYIDTLTSYESHDEKWDRFCELNVMEQVFSVSKTPILQQAWKRGQEIKIHGWIYGIHDGLLRDLDVSISSVDESNGLSAKLVNKSS